ncbi:MAG: ribosome-associated translation inhibitor RaiA [Candidatus Moranbacteria bacterium]|nr:ribosome-associated translation inhibitor RaiA [Candidatus Moranbacteria bacterium]
MNISYSFVRTDMTEESKEYIEKRVTTLQKFFNKVTRAEVSVNKDKKGFFSVRLGIMTPGKVFTAKESAKTVEAAVDELEDAIKTQVRRTKEKAIDLGRRRGRSVKKKIAIDDHARF